MNYIRTRSVFALRGTARPAPAAGRPVSRSAAPTAVGDQAGGAPTTPRKAKTSLICWNISDFPPARNGEVSGVAVKNNLDGALIFSIGCGRGYGPGRAGLGDGDGAGSFRSCYVPAGIARVRSRFEERVFRATFHECQGIFSFR